MNLSPQIPAMMPTLSTKTISTGNPIPAQKDRPPARMTPNRNRKTMVRGLIMIFTMLDRFGAKNYQPIALSSSRITPAPSITQNAFGRNRIRTTMARNMITTPAHV